MKPSKLLLVVLAMFLFAGFSFPLNQDKLAQKAAKIHDKVLTVDTHVDTPMRLVRSDFNLGERHDPGRRGGKVDFPRMKEGGLDAIFFAVFVGQGERNAEGARLAYQKLNKNWQ